MPWQVFDHTADLGLRVEAPTRAELFEEAGRALTSLVVETPDATVRARERIEFALTAAEPSDLLFDWLHALLVAFEVRHLLFVRFAVEIDEVAGGLRLRASAWGERVDRSRQQLAREVKAITYHGLFLRPEGDGWAAEVIVDV
jgi:SHS2 domain-containing protein